MGDYKKKILWLMSITHEQTHFSSQLSNEATRNLILEIIYHYDNYLLVSVPIWFSGAVFYSMLKEIDSSCVTLSHCVIGTKNLTLHLFKQSNEKPDLMYFPQVLIVYVCCTILIVFKTLN